MINVTNLRPLKTGAVIASAVLLASCATTSNPNNPRPDPIIRIAKSVGEAGTRVWDGTRYLFKLKDQSSGTRIGDEYADEVDMALLDVKNFEGMDNTDAEGAEATAVEGKLLIEGEALESEQANAEPLESGPSMEPSDEDLYHTIGDNETLWVLAKMLTGNANNWRQLAELNELDENGSVYVGQTIRVPAALKRVPVEQADTGDDTQLAAAKEDIQPVKPAETVATVAAPEKTEPAQASIVIVQAGESLWHLSERTTGKPENWFAIAQFNGMDEKAANQIRFGQKLKIPAELLIEGAADTVAEADNAALPATDTAKTEAANAVAAAITPKDADGIKAGTTDGKRETVLADAKPADGSTVITVPANFKGEPPANLPKEAAAKATAQTQVADSKLPELQDDEIMVSGTYYPKAIYNEANFSSSLLMRVSPGTKLKVSKALGPWYEVVTDKGVGFVHSRDTK